jgi:mono/diheme cytochrome c family protein
MRTQTISLLALAAAALFGPQAAAQDSDAIASQVRALFTDKCIDCHGSKVEKPKAGFKGVELVDELLKNPKYIKRFDPANSLLYQHLSGAQTPQMPKGDDPLSAAQLTLVRAWIGEKLFGSTTTPATAPTAVKFVARPIIDDDVVLKLIHADLVALPAADRVNYRYITYANLWNERLPDGTSAAEQAKFQKETDDLLESTRLGFAKMLNSLSWSPSMVMPKAIDKDRLVYRIDLRGMLCAEHRDHWSGKQWDMLCARFPYGRKIGAKQEDEIVQWLGTELPCVRADWFVFATSRPPLYHDLLGLPGSDGKPGADYALERLLGIDVRKNILEGMRIARAGIHDKKSGVSQHNRLIERHERAAGAYYWKSYDFGDSVGTGNLVLHPLGPANLEGLPDNQREFAFEHAGGEIIFSLPNGLQGYLLVTSDGTRIDDGPSKIVFDRDDSADVKGQITNGVSCIACHSGGINLKLDQIRDGALKIVPRGLRDELEALFPANDAMDRMQKADKARFMAATAKLGIVDGCDQTQCEAVRKVSQRFAENVTFERAAAEFSKGLAVFRAAFGGKLIALRAQLETGAVSRAEFINRFRQLVGDNPDFGEMSGCGTALGFAKPEAPASTTKAPLETAPAATRLPTIDQQIETLSKTESSLLGPDLKNPSLSDPQLGLIRYKLADALYRKALLHIKTYKDKQAEIGIGHAIAKFLSVLDSPDSSDSGEGSSLHASALRRSIQSEAILVRGYQNLNKATAQKHASAAEQTYGLLKNSYRDATLPNGQLVVDAVRHDIDRQR